MQRQSTELKTNVYICKGTEMSGKGFAEAEQGRDGPRPRRRGVNWSIVMWCKGDALNGKGSGIGKLGIDLNSCTYILRRYYMKEIKVKFTFIEMVLGTANNNKEVHSDYIASKAPDAKSKTEEIEAIGVEGVEEKSMTVFPRDENGNPMFWDYQIKGFFKDTCSALQRCKGEEISKASCKLKAYKKIIDGCIFVFPRKIPIDMHGGEIGTLQRPLRAQTMQGERIALATSETVPAGSSIEFTIICLSDEHEAAVKEWLTYGQWKGLGQWRNASYGRFKFELIE